LSAAVGVVRVRRGVPAERGSDRTRVKSGGRPARVDSRRPRDGVSTFTAASLHPASRATIVVAMKFVVTIIASAVFLG
jgi:hypothetical protein